MRVGFDFHNVLDAYPQQMGWLTGLIPETNYTCVISAIGPRRKGTVAKQVEDLWISVDDVFEVIFKNVRDSPALKTMKALALNLDMFFDDRQDVCDAMNAAGILCFKVPRIGNLSDIAAEVK